MTDPIDDYLVALRGQLEGRDVDGDRVADEVECHLRDIQDEIVAGSRVAPVAAARLALERFGDVRVVVAGFHRRSPSGWESAGHWAIAGLAVVGAGAGLEAVATDGRVGSSLWVRFLLGLLGLALADVVLLRAGTSGPDRRGIRVLAAALGLTGAGCLVAGLVLPGGGAWLGTAAAAGTGAIAAVVVQRGYLFRYT